MIELAETFTVNWGGAERVQRVRWKGWSEEDDGDLVALRSLALPVGELNVRCLKDGSHQRTAQRTASSLSLLSPPAPSISPRFPSSPTTGPTHDLSVSHKDPASKNPTFTLPHKFMSPLLSVLSMLTYSLRAHKGKLCTERTYRHMDISM